MDILFFAAIAIFIFFKLREQLGKISDEEKEQITQKIKAQQQKIAQMQAQAQNQAQFNQQGQANQPAITSNMDEKILAELSPTLKSNIQEILAKSNIGAEFFINGTKSCFEMIIKSFANKDIDTLKFLLSDKIFNNFETVIKQRELENKILNSNIISLDKAEIIAASIVDNQASITVKILSKQINYITNNSGEVVDGRKDEIIAMTDIWTFKRDLTSTNPNWIVVATG